MVALLAAMTVGCGDDDTAPATTTAALRADWPAYGGGLERRFFNAGETAITKSTVKQLIPRWRFLTGAVVMASPVVADVNLPGAGDTRLVFVSSWDRHLYALRAADGGLVWAFEFKRHPGSDFQQSSSAAVADVDGRRLVFVGSGETMYGVDAATGALVWEFDVGTGCTTCDREQERNEIASSPAFFDGVVYFGMDVNELPSGKGGLFAVDARKGTLRWYFDVQTAATCRPNATDAVRRFDGFHTAAQLGLPDDFFATRAGCAFDRTPDGCGGIWASPAIDTQRGLLFADSNNCDKVPEGADATPPFDEAIFALTLDGVPSWVWRPRPFDPLDLDFGVPPNLFEASIGGANRAVVGVGGKDGTYYVLDRSGVNALTGRIEPYWITNAVPGGSDGGIIAPAAVGQGRVLFSTAIGGDDNDFGNYQKPAAWGLNAGDGSVAWSNDQALPSFSPTSAIPDVVFMGSILGNLFAYDAASGERLATIVVGGALSSPAVVADGQLYIGSGTGAREGAPEDVSFAYSLLPNPVSAFCIAGTDGCPPSGKCVDGDPCTSDELQSDGTCRHPTIADGTSCRVGALTGTCAAGKCTFAALDCDDGAQCTHDTATPTGCVYTSEPETTPCTVDGSAGTCREGVCEVP
jgi:outer membrane protein assembly factor BamB